MQLRATRRLGRMCAQDHRSGIERSGLERSTSRVGADGIRRTVTKAGHAGAVAIGETLIVRSGNLRVIDTPIVLLFNTLKHDTVSRTHDEG
jgi:hypothetical protein